MISLNDIEFALIRANSRVLGNRIAGFIFRFAGLKRLVERSLAHGPDVFAGALGLSELGNWKKKLLTNPLTF